MHNSAHVKAKLMELTDQNSKRKYSYSVQIIRGKEQESQDKNLATESGPPSSGRNCEPEEVNHYVLISQIDPEPKPDLKEQQQISGSHDEEQSLYQFPVEIPGLGQVLQLEVLKGLFLDAEGGSNQNYALILATNSIVICEILLSAFDKRLKFRVIKHLILSVEFGRKISALSEKLSHFVEVRGKEREEDDMLGNKGKLKNNRTDILVCDPDQNLLLHLKLDTQAPDKRFQPDTLLKF